MTDDVEERMEQTRQHAYIRKMLNIARRRLMEDKDKNVIRGR